MFMKAVHTWEGTVAIRSRGQGDRGVQCRERCRTVLREVSICAGECRNRAREFNLATCTFFLNESI